MILDPKKIKSVTVCTFLPSICHEVVMPGLPGWLSGQEFTCDAEDAGDAMGLIPGLGRSPRGGHGNPLQCSCLENPHGQRSLAGDSPWDRKESDKTERLSTAQHSTFSLCVHMTLSLCELMR